MNALLQQAQQMQTEMVKAQESLAEEEEMARFLENIAPKAALPSANSARIPAPSDGPAGT